MIISVKRDRMDWEVKFHQARTGLFMEQCCGRNFIAFSACVKRGLGF